MYLKDLTKLPEETGFVIIFDDCKASLGPFAYRFGHGKVIFESDELIILEDDFVLLGLHYQLASLCSTCEDYFSDEDLGRCNICGEPVCYECQQPMTFHNQVDYNVHKLCYELQG